MPRKPRVPLPYGTECRECRSCLAERGVVAAPSRLLPTPPPGSKLSVRTTAVLIEDTLHDVPHWAWLLGPYIAGGGHRSLVSEYVRRAKANGYSKSRLRWGGEAVVRWNGRCLVPETLNDTSGMIARRDKEALKIPYEEMPVGEVATLIGKLSMPSCREETPEFRGPDAVGYVEGASHFNPKLTELSRLVPGENLRHDLINALFGFYAKLIHPQVPFNWDEASQATLRRLARATVGFFEVVKEDDPLVWARLDAGNRDALIVKMRLAQMRGYIFPDDLMHVMDLIQEVGNIREVLEFRFPQVVPAPFIPLGFLKRTAP